MTTMPLGEARSLLIQTRDQIASEPDKYAYEVWQDCVCGHLYQVSMGKRANLAQHVSTPTTRTRYGKLMATIDPIVPNRQALGSAATPLKLSAWVGISNYSGYRRALNALYTLIEDFDAHYGPQGMDIGKEVRTIQVEPAQQPVPERVEQPRRQIPSREPSETPTPERTPEKVPAE